MDFWIIFKLEKLENYFYFYFDYNNGTRHTNLYIKLN